MRYIILFLVILVSDTSKGQDFVFNYIDTYKDISIEEMNKYGIPASITIAQGMLESNWGRSDLAVNANNHFGIKCGKNWTGESFSWEDDEYKKGQIVKSCFRVYNSVSESFDDHSDFLSKQRYRFLYDYDVSDYKSWAKGLVKAGYATDPKYADKLILIIENYGLYKYDLKYSPVEIVSYSKPASSSCFKNKKQNINTKNTYRIDYINGSKVAYAKNGDSPETMSKTIGVSLKRLLKYNDGWKKKNHKFKENDIVFLEKKKKAYYGNQELYIASNRESLAEISQKFGVKLKYLAKINKTKSKIKFRKGRKVLLKPISKRTEWAANTKKFIDSKRYLFEEALSPRN